MDNAATEPIRNDENVGAVPPRRDNAPIEANNAGAAFPCNDDVDPEPLCDDDHMRTGPPRAATTTHTKGSHAMTTQAQNPCAMTTTLFQGHRATMTMRAQSPCVMTFMRTQYDDEGIGLHRRRVHISAPAPP